MCCVLHAQKHPTINYCVKKEDGTGKVALDLGTGSGPAIPLLMQKGWKVIAIDSSPFALQALRSKNTTAITTGRLQVIEADITSYIPSAPVDLVIASDVLCYVDPAKFKAIWMRISTTCVKENGFFIASLFRNADNFSPKQKSEIKSIQEMGAWLLPDRRMVRPLLTHAGYAVEKCVFRKDFDDPEELPFAIQFVAKKMPA